MQVSLRLLVFNLLSLYYTLCLCGNNQLDPTYNIPPVPMWRTVAILLRLPLPARRAGKVSQLQMPNLHVLELYYLPDLRMRWENYKCACDSRTRLDRHAMKSKCSLSHICGN